MKPGRKVIMPSALSVPLSERVTRSRTMSAAAMRPMASQRRTGDMAAGTSLSSAGWMRTRTNGIRSARPVV